MSEGSCREAWVMAACTSWAAASMSRSSVNWSVICVRPRVFDEVIESTPAMVENCRSRGVATDEAMVSGLAPGRLADTWMVGKSTLGRSLTGKAREATTPNSRMASIASVGGGSPFHDLHLGPRNQPQLAVGDDDLARLQALLDDGQALDGLAGLDRARLHRAVRLCHID